MSQNRDGTGGSRTFCQIRRLFEVLRSIDLLGEATVSAVQPLGSWIGSHRTVARDFDVPEIACLIECIGVSIAGSLGGFVRWCEFTIWTRRD